MKLTFDFKESIKDGTLTLKGISLWSKSKDIATILAKAYLIILYCQQKKEIC